MHPRPFTPHVPPISVAGPPSPGARRLYYGPSGQQFGDLRVPSGPGPYPVVIMVHGGAWMDKYHLDMTDGLCEDLTRRGLATWNLEYSRWGDCGGEGYSSFADAARAADFLRTAAPDHGLDLARVVAAGHSAGGCLALWLAARPRLPAERRLGNGAPPLTVGAVAAMAPVADLIWWAEWSRRRNGGPPGALELMLGAHPSEAPGLYEQVSPAHMLPLGVRQLLLQGTEDRIVPADATRRYAEAARAAGDPLELVEYEGSEHFEMTHWQSAVWADIARRITALAGV